MTNAISSDGLVVQWTQSLSKMEVSEGLEGAFW